jgi:hypothetical protein
MRKAKINMGRRLRQTRREYYVAFGFALCIAAAFAFYYYEAIINKAIAD